MEKAAPGINPSDLRPNYIRAEGRAEAAFFAGTAVRNGHFGVMHRQSRGCHGVSRATGPGRAALTTR